MKRLLLIGSLVAPVVVWSSYWALAKRISAFASQRWGERILRAGDGKFSDVAVFLQHRFYEAAWLITVTVIVSLGVIVLGTLIARRLPVLWKWVPFSVAGFLGVNLWLKCAFGTCLFWCLFWTGKGSTNNLTQFHIKLLLMNESPAPLKVVLAGSSQVLAQIDARELNEHLGPKIFTTQLYFPGNRAYDFLLLNRKLEGHQVDAILCYLSELNFFEGAVGEGLPFFLTPRDLPEFHRLLGQWSWSPRSMCYGLLGDVLPPFWIREPLAERLLGIEATKIRQKQRDAALDSNLSQRAAEFAAVFGVNAQSDFSFHAFDAFVEKCRARHRTVIACFGQVNPVLARRLDPTLRNQMRAFLRKLATRYDNFILLEEDNFPPQGESDYEDLTHVGPVARARFTETLEPILRTWGSRDHLSP